MSFQIFLLQKSNIQIPLLVVNWTAQNEVSCGWPLSQKGLLLLLNFLPFYSSILKLTKTLFTELNLTHLRTENKKYTCSSL